MSYLIPYIFLVFLSLANNRKFSNFTGIFIWIFLVIFIGFRFEVGADWFNYKLSVERAEDITYSDLLLSAFSPGYALLLKICAKYNWGVYGLNIINAGVFSGGLIYFCKKLKDPFLGLIASYPYLIVVVSMGYITQASAIGIILIGLTFYQNNNTKAFYLSIALATMFHNSAFLCVLIPLIDRLRLIKRKSSLISLSLLTFVFAILYIRYLGDYFASYYNSYFSQQIEAQGGLVKLLVLMMYAITFIVLRNKFQLSKQQKNLLFSLSILSISLFFFSLTIEATVTTYRLSLYFYSLQLYVTVYFAYSRFLNISANVWKFFFYLYNFLFLAIWVLFANHAYAWIPYKNILLESIF